MILVLGILICLLPFLLVFLFEDRLKGLSFVLVYGTGLHLLIAVITQYFGWFTYSTVIILHILALCIIIIAVFYKKRKFTNLKLNPLTFFVFLIIFFQFWTVHYNYTGTVNTIIGLTEVQHSSYSYPLYSDEWVAAGLAKYSIKEHKLPLVNPFNDNKSFPNLLMVFHSVLAELFLISGLDPVANFAVAAIAAGMGVCLAVFILLRFLRVDNRIACITILFIPFITQSGFLPGLWFILPYTVGLIFLLISIAGFVCKDMRLAISSSVLSAAFYPPILVFIAPLYVIYFRKNMRSLMLLITILATPVLISETVASKICRSNLDGGMMSYPLWHILPVLLVPFVIVGMYSLYKKREYALLTPVTIGLLYWLFYAFYPQVVVIEYPRIVIITSILLVVVAGVGMNRFKIIHSQISTSLALGIFGVLAFFYPIGDMWEHIELHSVDEQVTVIIQSPPSIQRHLTSEDLLLFKDIHDIKFIAPLWKGLVLGVVTDNDPLESKPSTIATKILPYAEFMVADCQLKNTFVQKYDVSFVYSARVDCPGFIQIGQSREGLKLYRVEN